MHDVFPKARFRDCIAMTEKLGHRTQLIVMRKQWIDNTKPGSVKQQTEEEAEDEEALEALHSVEREQQPTQREQTGWSSEIQSEW